MYERFTDRARKTLRLANDAASALHHEYVGTEHLLLGLIKEEGVAALALKELGVDLAVVEKKVFDLVQAGPDVGVYISKLPHTPRMKAVIEETIMLARLNGDNYVGTQHLLQASLNVIEGVAYTVLTELGVTKENLKEAIAKVLFMKKEDTDDVHSEMLRSIASVLLKNYIGLTNAESAVGQIKSIVGVSS